MPATIGELRFFQGGRACTARLDSRLHWRCDHAEIESFLNDAYPTPLNELDSHQPAIHLLYQVAERLGAQVYLSPELRRSSRLELLAS